MTYSITTNTSPASTFWFSPTLTSVTLPAEGAYTSFSIFIASRTSSKSPLATSSPSATLTSKTVPVMGASTAPPPTLGLAVFLGFFLALELVLGFGLEDLDELVLGFGADLVVWVSVVLTV